MTKIHWTKAALLALTLTLAGAALADGEFLMHARVSFDTGAAMVKGPDDSDWSAAVVNTLIMPADALWVDEGGTAEIEMSGASFLRLADGAKADISALPPNTHIRGWTGSFYIQRLTRSRGDFVFTTPSATLTIAADTLVRVDIDAAGAAVASVRWGQVMVRTDQGGDTTAGEGMRVWIDPGFLPSEPTPFDRSQNDAFDDWNSERARLLAEGTRTAPKHVTMQDTTLGVHDLPRYGEWVHIDSRPYWRPTVVRNYVPYRYGNWNYVSSVGHVWVDEYPFAYVTSHYGRWRHTVSYGWVWSYDPVWSPAWVASVRVGDYYAWAPVDYYHRPVIVTGGATFAIGGISFSRYSTSYVRATHVYAGPTYIHAPTTVVINNFVSAPPRQVNVWRITPETRRRPSVPFDTRHIGSTRDYNPRRSIRGAQGAVALAVAPAQRAQRLEAGLGRSSFASSRPETTRSVRTATSDPARVATTRQVRLTQTEQTYRNLSARSSSGTSTTARKALTPESSRLGRVPDSLRSDPSRTTLRDTDRPSAAASDRPTRDGRPTPEGVTRPQRTTQQGRPTPEGVTQPQRTAPQGRPTPEGVTRPQRTTPQGRPTPEGVTRPQRTTPQGRPTPEGVTRPQRTSPQGRPTPEGVTRPQRTTPQGRPTPEGVTQPQRTAPQGRPTPEGVTRPQRTAPQGRPTAESADSERVALRDMESGTPAPRTGIRDSAAPGRTPVRQERSAPIPPKVNLPSRQMAPAPSSRGERTPGPSIQRPTPTRTPAPAPTVRRQSAPGASVQRSTPTPTPAPAPTVRRQSAPGASVQRSTPTPTPAPAPTVRRQSAPAPSIQRPAPTPAPAPTVRRQSTPGPSIQRPAPTPAPTMRRDSTSSRSAPSLPSVRPKTSAPSRSSAPTQRSAPTLNRPSVSAPPASSRNVQRPSARGSRVSGRSGVRGR